MAQKIVSREEALAKGQGWYFTGRPCKHGHIAKRSVPNWTCRRCWLIAELPRKRRRRKVASAWKRALRAERERRLQKRYGERYIPKSLARRLGLRCYFIGRPCRNGHLAERDSHGCVICRMTATKIWRVQNPTKILRAARRWRAANPNAVRALIHNRRARRMRAGGTFTRQDVIILWIQQKGRCAGCTKDLRNYHVDHKMPLALGGRNDRRNLQLLCPRCNLSKGALHPRLWRLRKNLA